MSSPVKRWLLSAIALLLLGACGTQPEATTARQPTTSPTVDASAGRELLPADPSAEFTIGDTVRLSGGEFVGDQADLLVEEAVLLRPEDAGGTPRFAFLVAITGLDPETFPYNLRDFSLFDDENFEYQPLFAGGEEPRLEFGDLGRDQQVRGWLTFEGPTDPAYVELVYAPALALEPARVRVTVP